jgi:MYXO-CTERM domain-containing protein
MRRLSISALVACAATLVLTAIAPQAKAVFVVNILQQGPNVVATGSGSLNLQGLTFAGSGDTTPAIIGSFAFEVTGVAGAQSADSYGGLSGPTSFGSGGAVNANSGSGDHVGVFGIDEQLMVSGGYTSGTALSSTSTFSNTTIAGLGLNPGLYTYTLPSDTYYVSIGSVFTAPATSVPEPGTVYGGLAAALGLGGLAVVRRKRPALHWGTITGQGTITGAR